MKPKERAVAALTLQVPDQVPTFELEFQLEEEMFGKTLDYSIYTRENLSKLSQGEKDIRFHQVAEHLIDMYQKLEYSIIPGPWIGGFEDTLQVIRIMRKMVGDNYMIHFHGDGTFAVPDGNEMYDFAYALADDPDSVLARADKMANDAIERNKRLFDAGIDCFILCSDYCYNSGPFVSPKMFGQLIQPYLYRIIDEARKMGAYTIKHTDGNIMPILDQLVECRPHAIHSLDPMAKVDIKTVKELVGEKVCLCGNVNCALMQTGTEQEVIESAEYCLTYGKPNGGYIFCTSNVPFKGLPAERYRLILDVWKKMRVY
jgi:uroporphyrinogen decarboxylase